MTFLFCAGKGRYFSSPLWTLVRWIFRQYFLSFLSVAEVEFTFLEVLEDSRGRLFSPLNPEGYDVLLLERLSWNNFSMGQNIFSDPGKQFPTLMPLSVSSGLIW